MMTGSVSRKYLSLHFDAREDASQCNLDSSEAVDIAIIERSIDSLLSRGDGLRNSRTLR